MPEHPAARQARTRAWQQIAAIGPAAAAQWPRAAPAARSRPPWQPGRDRAEPPAASAARSTGGRRDRLAEQPTAQPRRRLAAARLGPVGNAPAAERPLPGRPRPRARPSPPRPLARVEAAGPKGRFLLWVDAVGGYLVCLDDRIVLGRAGPDSHADVPLMGDLSRNHATLVRNGEGYLLQAHHASFVNGKPVVDQAVLRDGDVIRLGSTVELEFRQPSPVSATARLSIVSRHRLPLAVDGVLLMAETCIVGEAPQAHIPAPALNEPGRPLSPGRRAAGAAPPAPSTSTAEPAPPAPL